MKKFLVFTVAFFSLYSAINAQDKAIVIDHSCTNIENVPESWIINAKSEFRIAYGHTSHGSQIISGMDLLQDLPNSIFTFNKGTSSLYLNDASVLEGDLGNPDRQTWAAITRKMLSDNKLNINVVMWSWCGQVDGSISDIDNYLSLMNQLEQDFPSIKFVYMTGHLDGSGINGNVNKRNEQIRKFCKDNNKTLFDFADIESYDPDGNYFLDKNADDGCNYDGGNWADEWCQANPGKCSDCDCAHSKCINCQQKGKAFWWMLARLSGWESPTSVEIIENGEIVLSPNPASDYIEINIERCATLQKCGTSEVKIYNTYGELVISDVQHLGDVRHLQRIDISHFPVGLYFIQVGNYSEKFMVVR